MSTEKIFETRGDVYEILATVTDCQATEGGFAVTLDRTPFFPGGGGQEADVGTINGFSVIKLTEVGEDIIHIVQSKFKVGDTVNCVLNKETRLRRMQNHGGEHIVSGIVNRKYGFNNVGFHMGEDDITIDFDGVLDRAQLCEIEHLANMAIIEDRPINVFFPSPEELDVLEYRSKKALSGRVRIVEIEGFDRCACCAPHVSYTGEIGLIKILDFEKHRGGTRINIAAGYRALYDYREKYSNVLKASALFSEPQPTVAVAAESFLRSYEELKARLKAARLNNARLEAELIPCTEGNLVCHYPEMTPDEMREVANLAKSKVTGVLVILTGCDGDYKYIMTSESIDLSKIYKQINAGLLGRGGGRDNMIQGSFSANLESIKEYFAKL